MNEENEHLINKIEDTGLEFTKLIIMAHDRHMKKEMSDEDWMRIMDIQTRRASELFDAIAPNLKKEEIEAGMKKVVDDISNDNR